MESLVYPDYDYNLTRITIMIHIEILRHNIFAHTSQFLDSHTLLYSVMGFPFLAFALMSYWSKGNNV